uniref:Uncharacterized protein n=1 Tax=Strigops habroptila TaxID=2489341 RepID=A0A672TDD6_STRHB
MPVKCLHESKTLNRSELGGCGGCGLCSFSTRNPSIPGTGAYKKSEEGLLTRACRDRTRGDVLNSHQIKQTKAILHFDLNPGKSVLMLPVNKLLLCFSRFAGQEFPPFTVFKIFLSTQGQGSKCGKRIVSPSNKAAADACKLMEYQKYHEQMAPAKLQCIVLLQPTSNLVESPAYFGGRNNCWRRLPLQNFPGTTIIHAIVDYAHSKTSSDRLKKELKFLLLRPQHQELWHYPLPAVSNVRTYTKFQL